MATIRTATWSGNFGTVNAGTSGRTTSLSSSSTVPSNSAILKVEYSLTMSATKYSSANDWDLYWMHVQTSDGTIGAYIGDSNDPSVVKSWQMTSSNGDLTGELEIQNKSVFQNSNLQCFAKANNDMSSSVSTSYMKSISITVTYSEYEPSTFTCGSTLDFGEKSLVTLSNDLMSDLSHIVKWKISDSYQYSKTLNAGVNTVSYTIPTSWMASCPNQSSIVCEVTVETISEGSTIGTNADTILLNVPLSIKPSIGSLTASIYSDTSSGSFATNQGVYIQNLCGVKLTANDVTAGEYSTIASYTFSSSSQDTGASNENTFSISKLRYSGTIEFTVTVTDGRGRTASEKCSIDVIPYSYPVISAYDAYRCVADGTGSENGTYAQIRCAATVSPVVVNGEEKNAMQISSYYYLYTTGTPNLVAAIADMTSGQTYVVGGGGLDTSSTYYARFVVVDAMGGSTQVDVLVSSAAYAIHVKNGGTGVAFGKTSEISNSVEINPGWSFYYKGFLMSPVVYSESEPSKPVANLIWLKPKS